SSTKWKGAKSDTVAAIVALAINPPKPLGHILEEVRARRLPKPSHFGYWAQLLQTMSFMEDRELQDRSMSQECHCGLRVLAHCCVIAITLYCDCSGLPGVVARGRRLAEGPKLKPRGYSSAL